MTDLDHVSSTAITVNLHTCEMEQWGQFNEVIPMDSGSSVGIANDYGLGGPGSIPGGDEILCPSRPALGPTQPPIQWVPVLSRG